MTEKFNDKHLLWWVFRAIIASGENGLNQLDLTAPDTWEKIKAPDWVLPALHEKLEDVP